MPKRLAEAKAKYMKAVEDARKPTTTIKTVEDFARKFEGD
jgi:hypothetical protein